MKLKSEVLQYSFKRGCLARSRKEPKSTDPKSILVRNKDWEEVLDAYDKGWDFQDDAIKLGFNLLSEYKFHDYY